MLEAAALTDPGKVRSVNQDSWRIVPELGLYLIADGMGGARGGERASQLAVDSVIHILSQTPRRDAASLLNAVEAANLCVLEESRNDPRLEGMGTTIVAVLETGPNDLAIASVGDSRAYLLRDRHLRAITEDQTWVQDVGRSLGLDEISLKHHPMRHVLTMAVGVGTPVRIRYYGVLLEPDDLLLLSSDGLHGVIDDRSIEEILRNGNKKSPVDITGLCRKLVAAAHEEGSPDNVTVLLIRPA